jgi:hypothetical protein
MKKLVFIIATIAMIIPSSQAQKDVHLTIKHLLGDQTFAFNQAATNDLGNDFSITRVDYYLSKITIIHDGGMETAALTGTYILAKGNSNVDAILGNYNVTNIEGVKFYIGVDMPNNEDDPTQWVAPHPLAPQSPSMHWGWASGYRFVALEGKAGANLATGFEMHGLFNENYFEQTVMVSGVNDGNEVFINLDADYIQAIKGINVTSGPIDHGANATDLTVLQNFRDYVFSPGSGLPNSTNKLENELNASVFPNPSNGLVTVKIPESNASSISGSILDISGRIIETFTLKSSNQIDLNINQSGIYLLQLKDNQGAITTRKIAIR